MIIWGKKKIYIIRANQIPAFLSCRNDPATAGPHPKRSVGQSCDKNVDICKNMWQKMKVYQNLCSKSSGQVCTVEIYETEQTFSEETPSNHRGQSGDVCLHGNNLSECSLISK